MNRRLVFVLLLLQSATFAAENQWHWVKATNNVTSGWDVSEGNADVVIKDGQFNATLFWEGSTKAIEISLKGSVANGRLSVKETIHRAEFGGAYYVGSLTTKRWAEAAGTIGVETITLSDGLDMIGLTKTIKK
jgi:hypothetical protein